MSTGLLPASVLPGLLEIALQGRLNVQALFDRAGIDPDVVGRTDCYISQTQLDTLLSTAFSEVADPFFGVAVGRANHYTSLGLLGNLMATSDTLGMALQALLRYKDLLVPYLSFQLHDERDNVSISVTTDTNLYFTALPVHDAWAKTIRKLAQVTIALYAVYLAYGMGALLAGIGINEASRAQGIDPVQLLSDWLY